MSNLVAEVSRVNDLIGEISSATREQAQGIGQVSDAVNQLDQVTQQNAALVEESAAAADSLKQQANQLVGAVGRWGGSSWRLEVKPGRAKQLPLGDSRPVGERRLAPIATLPSGTPALSTPSAHVAKSSSSVISRVASPWLLLRAPQLISS